MLPKRDVTLIIVGAVAVALFLSGIPSVFSAAPSYGNYGSQVAHGNTDYAARFTDATNAHIARQEAGAPSNILDDVYYIHFGSTSGPTTANDIILTGSAKGTFAGAGTILAEVDTEEFADDLQYKEADGKRGYSITDFLYYSDDGTLNAAGGASGFADIQLSTGSAGSVSTTAGTIVTSSTADIVEAGDTDGVLPDGTTFETALSFSLKYDDRDGSGSRGAGDNHVFSAGTAAERGFYILSDVFAVTAGDGTYGAHPTTSTSGEVPILTDLSAVVKLVSTTAVTSPIASQHLFLHFPDPDDTDDSHILVNDIVLFYSSSVSYATRVSSTSNGLGETIEDAVNLQDNLFYIDIDGTSGYSDADALYLNRPATAFGGESNALTLTKNDIRLSTVPTFSSSFTAGTIVAEDDADRSAYASATANPVTGQWYVEVFNADRTNGVGITAYSDAKFCDDNDDGNWDAGEEVFESSDSSLTTSDYIIYADTLTDSTTDSKQAVASGTACTSAIFKALSDIKVTGADGTFDAGRSEYVYISKDAYVNAGDVRLIEHGVTFIEGSTVANSEDDASFDGPSSGDRLYFSWCRTVSGVLTCGDTTPSLVPHAWDIEVTSGGSRLSPGSGDHAPFLSRVTSATTSQVAARYSKGDPTSLLDDVFYLAVSPGGSPTVLNGDDLRLVPYDSSNPAGKAVASNSGELGAADGDITHDTAVFRSLLRYIDTDTNGYDVGDFVILDLPTTIGGANAGTYGSNDVRVTGTTGGGTSYAAGTMRRTTDGDNGYSTFATFGASEFYVYYFDENRDGVWDIENQAEDIAYLLYGTGGAEVNENPLTPQINAVRFSGGGGATSSTGGTTATTPTGQGSLSNPTISPVFGTAGSSFTFSVYYTDPLNRAPSVSNVIVGSQTHAMTSSDGVYTDGSLFTKQVTLSTAGNFAVSLSFTNSGGTLTANVGTVFVAPTSNAAPVLSGANVSPSTGNATTSFTFSVTYTDANNNAPTTKNLVIDGKTEALSSLDATYYDGAAFTKSLTLAPGSHSYYFEFSDGNATARAPETGTSAGPTVEGAASPSPDASTSPKKSPTPGFEGLFAAAALAAAVGFFARRRT